MKLEEWTPALAPYQRVRLELGTLTDREIILATALSWLVRHDVAADRREDLPNCVELQHAIEVLNAIARKKLWEPQQ
jgi:hypothetical protein